MREIPTHRPFDSPQGGLSIVEGRETEARRYVFRKILGASVLRCVVFAIVVAPACGVLSPEEQILRRFFAASRLHDTTVVASMSAVTFNPRTDGVVREFEIVGVEEAGDAEEVTVRAAVAAPDGQSVERMMKVRLERRNGRWFITAFDWL